MATSRTAPELLAVARNACLERDWHEPSLYVNPSTCRVVVEANAWRTKAQVRSEGSTVRDALLSFMAALREEWGVSHIGRWAA